MTINQKLNQPTITYNGQEHIVSSISWYSDGVLSTVGYTDQNGEYHTAFNKMPHHKDGYDQNNLLHLDLEKCVRWGSAELAELEKVE